MLNIGGFSEAAFRGVPIFLANHHGRFVGEVEGVELPGRAAGVRHPTMQSSR